MGVESILIVLRLILPQLGFGEVVAELEEVRVFLAQVL